MWNTHIEFALTALLVFCATTVFTMWLAYFKGVQGITKKVFYCFMYGVMSIYTGTVVYEQVFFIP